jgi:hypothetical protein
MMHETMKVIEAIGQLKIQEDRIGKALANLTPVAANRVTAKKVNGITKEEFNKRAKSDYDSATALLNRYIAMKEAINEFNAATKIQVAGQEMSVASAIYMKSYGIGTKKRLLNVLTDELESRQLVVATENGKKLDDAAERHAKQNFEGDTKADKAEYLKFLEDYREKNQYELIDPLNIREKIKDLEEEISKFEAGVDTAIQIANATHDITFEY